MLYKSFIAALLSGSYAAFSALQNQHIIHSSVDTSANIMVFECKKETTFIKTLKLSEWTHEQQVERSCDHLQSVTVVDKMTWPTACHAHRAYRVSASRDGGLHKQVTSPWQVKYSAGGNAIVNTAVSRAMQKELTAADETSFSKFVESLQ
jgi:hypothetical protein